MKDEFDERRSEIEEYFSFLAGIDNGSHRLVDAAGVSAYPASQQMEILKTLKANGFLLLYNLVESTVANSIESIFDELNAQNVGFDECRREVRRVVLTNIRRRKTDILVDDIRDITRDIISSSFRKEELFAGNVDAKAIREEASRYGFSNPRGPSTELLTVKTSRNDLAHGNKSFREVGRDYDIPRLLAIKEQVVDYLSSLIRNVEEYLHQRQYLDEASPNA